MEILVEPRHFLLFVNEFVLMVSYMFYLVRCFFTKLASTKKKLATIMNKFTQNI